MWRGEDSLHLCRKRKPARKKRDYTITNLHLFGATPPGPIIPAFLITIKTTSLWHSESAEWSHPHIESKLQMKCRDQTASEHSLWEVEQIFNSLLYWCLLAEAAGSNNVPLLLCRPCYLNPLILRLCDAWHFLQPTTSCVASSFTSHIFWGLPPTPRLLLKGLQEVSRARLFPQRCVKCLQESIFSKADA